MTSADDEPVPYAARVACRQGHSMSRLDAYCGICDSGRMPDFVQPVVEPVPWWQEHRIALAGAPLVVAALIWSRLAGGAASGEELVAVRSYPALTCAELERRMSADERRQMALVMLRGERQRAGLPVPASAELVAQFEGDVEDACATEPASTPGAVTAEVYRMQPAYAG